MAKKAPKANGTLLRRLTTKMIVGKVEAPEEGDEVELYSIYGVARSHDLRESTYGPSTRFMGSFEAVNAETGEIFRAPTCYLPEPVSGMLKAALDANSGDHSRGIKFGFKVLIVGVASNKVGYEYRTESLTEPQDSDEMQELRAAAGVKAIAGPKS